MKINLGSSDDLKPGWLNVDRGPDPRQTLNYGIELDYLQADLNEPWPWADSSVEAIYAHDVFEHLTGPGGVAPKIWAMNEAWRVLQPGGVLDLAVPCVYLDDGRINPGAFADPTHVSFWTMDDRYYFCDEWNHPAGERGRLGPAYGIVALFHARLWRMIEYGARGARGGMERRSKVTAILEAVK